MMKSTVADLVLRFPDNRSQETALIFLDSRGQPSSTFSFHELRQQCLLVAENLNGLVPCRSVMLLAIEEQADFVIGFFGAILAGLIPAPIAPWRHAQDPAGIGRLLAILKNKKATSVLVPEALKTELEALLTAEGLTGVTVLALEPLKKSVVSNRPLPDIDPKDIAYIQYTSGSTAKPKGVVLTHAGVIAHMAQMQAIFQLDGPAQVVSWIPLHHDMGLVGSLFTPLYESGLGVFMSPKTFLASPDRWLKAVSDYRANLSAAPTFAFEHCCRKIVLDGAIDLSHWQKICVGSETVALPILDRFCEKFSAAGFKRNAFLPVYGLAEATLLVAGGRYGLQTLDEHILQKTAANQRRRALIPYALNTGIEVDIRHPETQQPVAEGMEGEIWVKGPAVTCGYLEDLSSDDRFAACPEINTGDLGFKQGGFLYHIGRTKDIVIVRGVNYAAEDLEFAVRYQQDQLQSHDHCICVADIDASSERFYVFQEVQRHKKAADLVKLAESIQANLLKSYAIAADDIVLIPRGVLPRTANYKLARKECLKQYLQGELKVLYSRCSGTQQQQTLVTDDPVVVVGMACRLPGGVMDPEAFWQLLANGVDGITEVPAKRWENEVFYNAQPAVPGKVNSKWAGFVDDIDQFDPALFGISAHEAPELDPQQRMLLETSWRLIENIGWKKEHLAGSDTGVFVGISTNDYLYMKIKLSPGMDSFNAYSGLGNANSIAANRLSFFYDLKGPSMAVDTACSSSLTAFHLGAKAILSGDCTQAIVGGVNAILSPGPSITLSQFGMLSPVGRCKTFDSSADGYVRAEGCGLVMLKRRSAALRDGDPILAVLCASAVGQDGFSAGMTFPNGDAQNRLIQQCLVQARLQGEDINYVEAHGTGTRSGDPIEMEQIIKIYGQPADNDCYVGAVKANVGHLEAGAGITSVIKCLLMLQKKAIPPQIHFNTLNPRIHLQNSRLKIPTKLTDWQLRTGLRCLAISSFGFGGSLAHVILKEAGELTHGGRTGSANSLPFQPQPFVLSATSPAALQQQAKHWSTWLETEPELTINDICYTQAMGRSNLKFRSYFLVDSLNALKQKLGNFQHFNNTKKSAEYPANVCFLLTGQGEYYLHMGKELYHRFPVFKQAFDRCAQAIAPPNNQMTLCELAFDNTDTRHWDDVFMQPIQFAVQYALGMLWQDAGVTPYVLLGHSLGEYAAACLAGCFEPETGMQLLKKRAELTNSIAENGFMVTVFTDHYRVREVMDASKVQIAAINSTKKTVISGEIEEMERLIQYFVSCGVEIYRLKTSQAFHSHLIDPVLDEYQAYVENFEFKPANKRWLSSLRGDFMHSSPNARYWVEHLRQTVLFSDAVLKLDAEQHWTFLEVGPGASTLAAIRENLPWHDGLLLRSLNIKKGDRTELFYFLDSLGKLYQAGFPIQWENLLSGQLRPESVPGQQFSHRSYWIKGLDSKALTAFAHSDGMPLMATNGLPPIQEPELTHYALDWVASDTLAQINLDAELQKNPFNWLVIGEANPLTERLLKRLRKQQKSVFWLALTSVNKVFGLKPDATLKPEATTQDWAAAIAVLENLRRQANLRDWKLVYLAQGEATIPAASTIDLERAVTASTGRFMPLLKALKANGLMLPVWVVCENAQQVGKPATGDSDLNLSLSALWGFSKTLFLEHIELRGGLIDTDRADDIDLRIDGILRKILKPQGESCIALRRGKSFIQQITAKKITVSKTVVFRNDGAFLITGGLGGLGLKCAEWITGQGGRHLLLLSRRALPDVALWHTLPEADDHYAVIQSLLRLKNSGIRVDIVSQDIRDTVALEQLFAQYTIRGVVHAAGVNWFSKVMDLDRDVFLETLKIKVSSAWALHQLSQQCDLDCFILFSSVSALWGSVELSHYTAANHFMDMLSLYRAQAGLASLSIDWGPWSEVGMSAKPHEVKVLQQLGFRLMSPTNALNAMAEALNEGAPLSLIVDINWDKFQTFTNFSLQPSLFAQVVGNDPVATLASGQNLQRIRNSSPEEARELIEKIVRMELRMVMLIESMDEIDAEQRFNFLGMDSLMAISFAAKLEEYFNCKLPNTLAYNYPHIKAVSDHLFERIYQGNALTLPMEQIKRPVLQTSPDKWLKVLKKATLKPAVTVFCFPYAGAGASIYSNWVDGFDDDVELVAINPPGREDWSEVSPFTSLDELVQQLEKSFIFPANDFYFFGHSLGALTAYALYQQLEQEKRPLPKRLILSGCNAPQDEPTGALHTLPTEAFVEEVAKYCINQRELIYPFESLIRADIQLFEQYAAKGDKVSVPLTVIVGTDDLVIDPASVKAWRQRAANTCDFYQIAGGRHDLVKANKDDLISILLDTIALTETATIIAAEA